MILCFPSSPPPRRNSGTAFRFPHFRDDRFTGETSRHLPVTVQIPHLRLLPRPSPSPSSADLSLFQPVWPPRCLPNTPNSVLSLCLCSSCSLCLECPPFCSPWSYSSYLLLGDSLNSLPFKASSPQRTLRYLNFCRTQCWASKVST